MNPYEVLLMLDPELDRRASGGDHRACQGDRDATVAATGSETSRGVVGSSPTRSITRARRTTTC